MDRDGTLVKALGGRPANVASELELLPGVASGLRALGEHGLVLVVVTNQGGIGHGYMLEEEMPRMVQRLNELLVAAGGPPIARTYWCPHKTDYRCTCRKPNPELYFQAASELGIDLSQSFAIGDAATDMDAATRAGIPYRIIVRSDLCQDSPLARFSVPDFAEAAKIITILEVAYGGRAK